MAFADDARRSNREAVADLDDLHAQKRRAALLPPGHDASAANLAEAERRGFTHLGGPPPVSDPALRSKFRG